MHMKLLPQTPGQIFHRASYPTKAQAIKTALLSQEIQLHQEEELKRLDDLHIQSMIQAKCHSCNIRAESNAGNF